jgi:hypothetical protein
MSTDLVRIPTELLARLIAAIEAPDDLTDEERTELLSDADAVYPYALGEDDQ